MLSESFDSFWLWCCFMLILKSGSGTSLILIVSVAPEHTIRWNLAYRSRPFICPACLGTLLKVQIWYHYQCWPRFLRCRRQRLKCLKIDLSDYLTVVWRLVSKEPLWILLKSYIARNYNHWATFPLIVWIYLHSSFFMVGSENRMCYMKQCGMSVQGHPKSLILAPIKSSSLLVINSDLGLLFALF